MKPRHFRVGRSGILFVATPLAAIVCQLSTAATIQKANNASALNVPTSWVGGVVPGASDIASWNATVTSANATSLGENLTWQGLEILNPGGPVTLGGANTLTLGTAGIAMSGATQNLAINANLTLAPGGQVWNIAAGQSLALGSGAFSRSTGSTLGIIGEGTVTSAMSGLANVNGILGPWAFTGSGVDSRYATLAAGTIQPFTGATALSGTAGVFGGMPSGGDGTANYDVSGTGTFSVYGLVRNINTLRYTGGGATQQSNTSADLLSINGIMNVGTGALNIGGGANALRVTIGASNNLVLAAHSGDLTLANEIKNGAGAGSVTVVGSDLNFVTLTGLNTYTGGTRVNSGTLRANSTSLNSGPVHVANGATLTFTGNNQNSTSTVTGSGAIHNSTANTVILTGDHTGFTGTFTHSAPANNTQFNSANAGSANAAYSITAGELIFAASGDYTVRFGSLSRTDGTIRGGNAATGTTTLEVGNLNTDSAITGNLNNGATKAIALTKVGSGTLTLSGTNTYSGLTTVSGGTLRIDGAISASSGISNNANLVFEPSSAYTYPGAITGSGTLTLTGGSTLNLTGSNNFAGTTVLDRGELRLQGNFGPITVADDWFNLLGPVASGSFTASSLTFTGEAMLDFILSGTPGEPAPLNISGALSTTPANGKVTLEVDSFALGNGTHNLINFGSFAGTVADFDVFVTGLNSRQSGTLVRNGSTLAIQVDGDTPKWTGLDSGVWKPGTTGALSNWKLLTGGTATNYQEGDDVLFDDTATGTTNIQITDSDVSPRVVLFNNSSKNYTLSGATLGIVSGAITKSGTGSLTIASNNLFNEGLTLQAGTLNVNSPNALGTGQLSIVPGPAKTLNNTSGAPITNASANAQSWFDDFTFTGTHDLDLGTGAITAGGDDASRTVTVSNGTLIVGELKAPSHGLVKAGPGTLVLTSTGAGADASTLAGTLDVPAGTFRFNRSGTDAAASGDLTATGIAGAGTIANGADVERWLFINTAETHDFPGTLTNGGPGSLGFNKQGPGSVTLSGAVSHTGQTTVEGGTLTLPVANTGPGTNAVVNAGTLVIAHPQALGAASTIRLAGNNVANLNLATDGGNNLYGFVFATTTNATIISNRATAGEGINHSLTTLGVNGIGGGTLTVTSGENVTTGAGRITFNEFALSAGAEVATILNPTSAHLTIGNVAKVANAVNQTLALGGTSDGNQITGVISNGTAVVSLSKSNSSTWTISNTNTYTGNTQVGAANGAGVLRATASGALGSGTLVFDGSGGNPGPTSRLELSGTITLANPISLHQRNNATPIILSTGGTNTLTGNINLTTGGNRGNIESSGGLLTLAGTISTTTAATRNLHLGGDGDGQVTGVIQNNPDNAAGIVAVHKNGAGTWLLAGANTNTGETTVNAGTLSVANPVLADGAAVRIAAGATLHLTHTGTDTVDRLFIDGVEQYSGTWGALDSTATHKTDRITGTGILKATNGTTPPAGYGTWAAATGLTAGVNDASTFDADDDGFDNGTEYILGGLPLNGANNPKIHSLLADSSADVDTDKELIMTIAVPQGTPAFSAGAPASSATFEGYVITVRGSTDLVTFPVVVTPVAAITTGLPPAPVQGGITYEYRSFSLNGSNGLSAKGFLNVEVTHP